MTPPLYLPRTALVRVTTERILSSAAVAQGLCTFLHRAIFIPPSCQWVSAEHGAHIERETCRVTLTESGLFGTSALDLGSLCVPSCCCLAEYASGKPIVASSCRAPRRNLTLNWTPGLNTSLLPPD